MGIRGKRLESAEPPRQVEDHRLTIVDPDEDSVAADPVAGVAPVGEVLGVVAVVAGDRDPVIGRERQVCAVIPPIAEQEEPRLDRGAHASRVRG